MFFFYRIIESLDIFKLSLSQMRWQSHSLTKADRYVRPRRKLGNLTTQLTRLIHKP